MTISAKVIADSITQNGQRITTFECEYWRAVHAEFMTHRMLSKNAASSRAIPVERQIQLINADTAGPVHWGKNQPGMSADEECTNQIHYGNDEDGGFGSMNREEAWRFAREGAVAHAFGFHKAGYHKQIVNRLLEPFAHIKIVVTATEWENFFYLRCHEAAQPDIQALAYAIRDARDASTPRKLRIGQWHVPYYQDGHWSCNGTLYENGAPGVDIDDYDNSLEDALAISASCCAQVSYRRNDDSLEKAKDIYKKLVDFKPVHASPFEHQATPIGMQPQDWSLVNEWPEGVTHADCQGELWSGNFKGWIQNRQLIPGHVYQP